MCFLQKILALCFQIYFLGVCSFRFILLMHVSYSLYNICTRLLQMSLVDW